MVAQTQKLIVMSTVTQLKITHTRLSIKEFSTLGNIICLLINKGNVNELIDLLEYIFKIIKHYGDKYAEEYYLKIEDKLSTYEYYL